jgi:hypothetical protein
MSVGKATGAMNRFDRFGGNLRQPEATSKRRLPHFSGYSINELRRSEATEATFLKVSHVREGKGGCFPCVKVVGERSPQLPHLCVSACVRRAKPEATSKPRLPQVASGGAV